MWLVFTVFIKLLQQLLLLQIIFFVSNRKSFKTLNSSFLCIEPFPEYTLWVGTEDIYCLEKMKSKRSSTYEIMIYCLKDS